MVIIKSTTLRGGKLGKSDGENCEAEARRKKPWRGKKVFVKKVSLVFLPFRCLHFIFAGYENRSRTSISKAPR